MSERLAHDEPHSPGRRRPDPLVGPHQGADGRAPSPGTVLGLQRTAGNRAVSSMVAGVGADRSPTVQRDGPTDTNAVTDRAQAAGDFEGRALVYFENNLRAELMATAGSEGLAIGMRASAAAGDAVRSVCEPYEADQELDTEILNTVFAVTGGAAGIGEGFTGPVRQMNVASRAFRAAQGVTSVWIPRLAGYRTVGSLKSAAMREASEAAQASGEGASGSFTEYQDAALDALHGEWVDFVSQWKQRITSGEVPPGLLALGEEWLLNDQRPKYVSRLRTTYGAGSAIGTWVAGSIVRSLEPHLDLLRDHLEQAKAHREHVQELAAIAGGVTGGAAIGAGFGALAGGVGAVPGAVIGGLVGLVGGLIGAAAIAWD